MKVKAFVIAIVLAFSTQANAEVDRLQACQKLYSTASNVMTLRQAGYPLGDLLEKSPDIKIVRHIILSAYSKPIYEHGRHKRKMINNFSQNVYTNCVKAGSL